MAKAQLCLLSPQINTVILLHQTEIYPKGGERDQILLIRRAPSASAPQSLPRFSSAQSLEKIHGKGKADGEKGAEEAPAAAGFVQRCGVSQRKGDGQQKHKRPQPKDKCTANCVAENAEEATAVMLRISPSTGPAAQAPAPLPLLLIFPAHSFLSLRCVFPLGVWLQNIFIVYIYKYTCVCVYTHNFTFVLQH